MGDIIEMNVNEMNQSKAADMTTEINYDALKVIEYEIPYSKVVDFIEFVRFNSYGKKDGKYHEYLMDYSEAVAILTMYTDCDSYEFKFDDVMKFIQSERWARIKEELGDAYINFHYYIKKEIEYANTPLRYADDAIKKATETMDGINSIIGAIDIDALKNYDFSRLTEAIDAVGGATEEK